MLNVIIDTHAIHIGPRFSIAFLRTLRIPDDGHAYPLPPGLGAFPLYPVATYTDRLPPEWRERGGVLLPMYQREALWLGFRAAAWKPTAVKIAIGHVNAISGAPYHPALQADPQDYLVCPEQLWLDGVNTGHGTIRQFVAMPLGQGYSVEASLSGSERVGGIQITAFEPKPGLFPDEPPRETSASGPTPMARPATATARPQQMGLGAGGVMRQKIYPDPYGIHVWDQTHAGSVEVHLVNSAYFAELTGLAPPPTPIDAQTYTAHGFPWFDLYDESKGDVPPPDSLSRVKTVAERDIELGTTPTDTASVQVPPPQIRPIHKET